MTLTGDAAAAWWILLKERSFEDRYYSAPRNPAPGAPEAPWQLRDLRGAGLHNFERVFRFNRGHVAVLLACNLTQMSKLGLDTAEQET